MLMFNVNGCCSAGDEDDDLGGALNQEHIDLWICGFVTNNEDEPIDMDMVYKTIDDTLCQTCGKTRSRSTSPAKRSASTTPLVSPTTQVVPDLQTQISETDTVMLDAGFEERGGEIPKPANRALRQPLSQPDSGIGMEEEGDPGICDMDSDGEDDLRSPILLKGSCDSGMHFCVCNTTNGASTCAQLTSSTQVCLHCSVRVNSMGETSHTCCICTCKHTDSKPITVKLEDGLYCLHCSVIESGDGKSMQRCFTCGAAAQGKGTDGGAVASKAETVPTTQESKDTKENGSLHPVVDSGSDLRPPPLPPEAVKGQPGQRQGKKAAVVGVKVSGQDKGPSGVHY